MAREVWKVGELAQRTGLTVRTLHHYDEIGLLSPSLHTEAGHRLYTARDVARLQQIVSLRQLGLSLEEIRDCLGRPDFSPLRTVETHLARLKERIDLQRRLCERLEAVAAGLRSSEEPSGETFLQLIAEVSMIEKYYTAEQLEQLRERKDVLGDERIRQAEAEWQELIGQVRAAMEQGADPASESVQALAQRWMGLVNEFTGGDPGIARSMKAMWQQEATIHGMETAPLRAMGEYIAKALEAAKAAE